MVGLEGGTEACCAAFGGGEVAGFGSLAASGQAGSGKGGRRVPGEGDALPQRLNGTLGARVLLTFPVLHSAL